jgi:SAM-dependent methyltransferase
MATMGLGHVQETWDRMGRDDPFWAVLSWEGTEHAKWDVAEFFAHGEREVAGFLAEARVVQASPTFDEALDFGCGVGRLSRALAERFSAVTGVDVSQPMIDQANRLVASQHANCRFLVNTQQQLPFPDDSFDLVLTNIVLQHLPAHLAQGYVREFLRVIRPTGIVIFQIPSHRRYRSTNRNRLVRAASDALPSQWREEIHRRRGSMGPRDLPMHGIPRAKVLRFVERHGGRVVACVEDEAAGPNWRSFHYIVRASRAIAPDATRAS